MKEVTLAARCTPQNMDEDDLRFVLSQLESKTKTEFIHSAIKIYRKYMQHELISKKDFMEILDKRSVSNSEIENDIQQHSNPPANALKDIDSYENRNIK